VNSFLFGGFYEEVKVDWWRS